ncbi:hypothetical protein MKX03_011700 [Papaver bracteatum]|nr:hypothetical protein MKX03_011700 [Papaver bracteatum]
MPAVCSHLMRPGRHAEEAPVISKQLSDLETTGTRQYMTHQQIKDEAYFELHSILIDMHSSQELCLGRP